VAVEHLGHLDFQLIGADVGQEAQAATVDAQYRDIVPGQCPRGAKQTAIAADHYHHVAHFTEHFTRRGLQTMTGQHLGDGVFKDHVHVPLKQEFFQSANRVEHLRAAQTTYDADIAKLLHGAPAGFNTCENNDYGRKTTIDKTLSALRTAMLGQ